MGYAGSMALKKSLNTLLADVVTMYFVAHGYHWNVEGQDFSQYHSLFGDIYGDVYGSVDLIAENLRKMGEYAPFNLQTFIDNRSVAFPTTKKEPQAMARALLKLNEGVLETLNTAFDEATAEKQQGIANFLADRIDSHQKWSWFLTASTKG
jgi:starvation-inducible DNA-binding protein